MAELREGEEEEGCRWKGKEKKVEKQRIIDYKAKQTLGKQFFLAEMHGFNFANKCVSLARIKEKRNRAQQIHRTKDMSRSSIILSSIHSREQRKAMTRV